MFSLIDAIEGGFKQKRRLILSLLLGGQNCLAVLAVLHGSYSSNRLVQNKWQEIEAMLSPKQQRRPWPSLLY